MQLPNKTQTAGDRGTRISLARINVKLATRKRTRSSEETRPDDNKESSEKDN